MSRLTYAWKFIFYSIALVVFFQGAKSSKEDKNKIVQLAFDTGHKLQDNAVVVGYIEDIHFI